MKGLSQTGLHVRKAGLGMSEREVDPFLGPLAFPSYERCDVGCSPGSWSQPVQADAVFRGRLVYRVGMKVELTSKQVTLQAAALGL